MNKTKKSHCVSRVLKSASFVFFLFGLGVCYAALMMNAAEHHDGGGVSATEHSFERRVCWDGLAYTQREIAEWYGSAAGDIWEAPVNAEQEITVVVLLSINDLRDVRQSSSREQHGTQTEARALLNKLCQRPEASPIDLTPIWKGWRAYIAKHNQCNEIIGSGIIALKAERIPNSSDPNRCGAKRLDFFVYRSDRSAVRLHPGNTRATDAAIVHVPDKVLQNTLVDVALIPQIDRIPLKDGFAMLMNHSENDTDITNGATCPWPRLVANCGILAPQIMGAETITKVIIKEVREREIRLEFTQSDATSVLVSLKQLGDMYGRKVKVSLVK